MNRREFLQQTAAAGASAAIAAGCSSKSQSAGTRSGQEMNSARAGRAWIVQNPQDAVANAPPVRWAIEELRAALTRRGLDAQVVTRLADARRGELTIVASDASHTDGISKDWSVPVADEACGIGPVTFNRNGGSDRIILAAGHDARGLMYALTDLADAAACGAVLKNLGVENAIVERPANQVRGIMRLFSSDVEDKPWYYDEGFWGRYLSMLSYHRFNRFNLALGLGYDFARNVRDAYFYFAYPFLMTVPGYDVRVTRLDDAERDRNLHLLRFASEQAVARGIDFQLGIWTHTYRWTDSPRANHTIEGVTPENHGPYCRDALKTLLQACPAISGITFRIHGESGVPEGSYDFWKTVFEGIVRCGRPVRIDLHAKGIDQRMIDVALQTGMPVTVAPKSWAEHEGLSYHQASIRPVEMPPKNRSDEGFFAKSSGSRSFMRYGFGDLMTEDRRFGILHRTWPGTQRLLMWGDPALAAGWGRASSFCGSVGLELFEPLSFKGRQGSGLPGGRDAYADESLKMRDDWQKYEYGYRLRGRLLYNPDTHPEVWLRFLRTQYGAAAEAAESALAHASRILPLITTAHCPSAANFNYWPEMYTNMPIVDATRPHPYSDTPSPKRFGTVSSLDPQLFLRIDDFAAELLKQESSGKYAPSEVAHWLEELTARAQKDLSAGAGQISKKDPAFHRLAADISIQRGLGRFFAAKIRAGILFALFERTADQSAHQEAIKCYKAARQAWSEFSNAARGIYRTDVTFGPPKHLRGHWADRLEAIDQDIADLERHSIPAERGNASAAADMGKLIQWILSPPPRPEVAVKHDPTRIVRGSPLAIEFEMVEAKGAEPEAQLFYRHVNEAEAWRSAPMEKTDRRYRAQVPADYADSPWPLQYYFQFWRGPRECWLYPGFNRTLSNQPYFVAFRGAPEV